MKVRSELEESQDKNKMRIAGEKEITLKFNDEEVMLKPFVEDMIKGAVLGMVKALKGYDEDTDITIEIK
jgi:hypothetical protein